MKFGIITPTYKRPDLLKRAIGSLITQTLNDWVMIIVNDNPKDGTRDIVSEYKDGRLIYIEQTENRGANSSRNLALESLPRDINWVIFLDDDDTLDNNALINLQKQIIENPRENWIVTNRIIKEQHKNSFAPKDDEHYRYPLDYLILRKIRGDATHCVASALATKHRFPTIINNGEEWLYYFSLSTDTLIYYKDIDTQISDPYEVSGLNLRQRSWLDQLKNIPYLIKEGKNRRLLLYPTFHIYIAIRVLRSFIK